MKKYYSIFFSIKIGFFDYFEYKRILENLEPPEDSKLFWGSKKEVPYPRRISDILYKHIEKCEIFACKPGQEDGRSRFQNFLIEK